jgi:pyridoxal phosphate enzyme (YggS family)
MVKENLAFCFEKIRISAVKAVYSLHDVTLIAVTKGVGIDFIETAIDNGVSHIGENKIQEALLKFEIINAYARQKGAHLDWHMVGHLQTNKTRDAVRMFDLIQSVDSLRLAQEIDCQAFKLGKIQNVLLEIKTSEEATKYGFLPSQVESVLPSLAALKNLRIQGLMTIAPAVIAPETARPYFSKLRQLQDKINQSSIFDFPLSVLSMGMTDDFETAISEGATMVRLGRAIFGERQS